MASDKEIPKENTPDNPQETPTPTEKVEAPSGDFFFGGSKKSPPPVEEEPSQERQSGGDIFIGSSKSRKSRPRKASTETTEAVLTEDMPEQQAAPIPTVESPIITSKDPLEVALGDKLFPMAQTLLYIFLGLACIGPIRAMMGGKPATEQLPLLLLFPFLILLHRKLIEKIESEFANGRDYLMGGIVLLFASLIVFTVSIIAPIHILMRPLGVISALCHMIYAVNVLQRIK